MKSAAWIILAIALLIGLVPSGKAAVAKHPVKHLPATPRSGQPVLITFDTAEVFESATVEYQVVLPGSYVAMSDPAFKEGWTPLTMSKAAAGFRAEIPANLQTHRALIRYRLHARDAAGKTISFPRADDSQPNFAYFVYDGIPAWKAALDPSSWNPRRNATVDFPPGVMGQVQSYFILARNKDVEGATWAQQSFGKEYRYTGTFVADGVVYDHVPFRARGGVWRYAMGKNMWKVNFNKGHHLAARDDYGQPYHAKWGKLNLRACIQQGDYGRRGEQGMYEAVGFRMFNLAGVAAPRTHWVSLRIVSEKQENPSNQYRGDFWGLYLAIENEDDNFLEEHGLPDGTLYKMMFGRGELNNQPRTPPDPAEINQFLAGIRRNARSEAWWRANVDLPGYYSYRAIVEAIHHYDIGDGKNYDFYCNRATGKWSVIPWDIDLTWGDHMYGSGRDPFYHPALGQEVLKVEYQNRLREIRDLLFNASQTGRLIDECAAIISHPGGLSIVDADRLKWDYHPIMAMGGKAGQGLFYAAARTHDFAGMVAQMKEYVNRRAAYIDRNLLADASIPATPSIHYSGAPGFPVSALRFKTSPVPGATATEWRAGQIDRGLLVQKPKHPGHYEITPEWKSGELGRTEEQIAVPADALQPGNIYRVRCRVKDKNGAWSHWSEPVEFAASAAR